MQPQNTTPPETPRGFIELNVYNRAGGDTTYQSMISLSSIIKIAKYNEKYSAITLSSLIAVPNATGILAINEIVYVDLTIEQLKININKRQSAN